MDSSPFWRDRLRAFFRLCIYLLLQTAAFFLLLFPVARGLAGFFGRLSLFPLIRLVQYELAMLAVVSLPIWLMCRFIERRPFATIGLMRRSDSFRQLLLGLGLGSAMFSLTTLLGVASRSFAAHPGWGNLSFSLGFTIYVLAMGLVALVEEMLFRGYLLQALEATLGAWPAAALTAAAFGVLHVSNPSGGLSSTLGIAIFGLLAAVIAQRTRTLWTVIGLHWAWNVFEGAIFGLPNSGLRFGGALFRTVVTGPTWWTGGHFGPEAGLISTLALLGGWYWFVHWRRTRSRH